MLTIRRLTFDLLDQRENFLTHLKLDSEGATFLFGDFFRAKKLNVEIEKPWLGEIRSDRFRIVRTRLGLFKINFSQTMVKGQIVSDKPGNMLKIEIGIPGHTIFNFLWGAIFLTLFISYWTKDIF